MSIDELSELILQVSAEIALVKSTISYCLFACWAWSYNNYCYTLQLFYALSLVNCMQADKCDYHAICRQLRCLLFIVLYGPCLFFPLEVYNKTIIGREFL